MSRTKTEVTEEVVVENTVNAIDKAIKPTVELMAKVTAAQKIGVVRYLQLYPQNSYVDAAMRFNYKSKVYVVEEWHKIAAKVKKTLGVE